jgi:hypothetical protein
MSGPHDPMLSPYSDKCRCMACGHYFRSSGTFARHRVGNWELNGANRRCLTAAEMAGKGWMQDTEKYWIRGQRSAADHRGAANTKNQYRE